MRMTPRTATPEIHQADEAPGEADCATPDAGDGAPAVEVQTIFRGVVIGTRHLSDPTGRSTHRSGTLVLAAGGVVALFALALFIATAWDVGRERGAFERWQSEGKDRHAFAWKARSRLGDVAVFGGFALGMTLGVLGLRRRGKSNPHFAIGPVAGADAPVASEFIPSPAWSHRLVAAGPAGVGWIVNVPPGTLGEVRLGRRRIPLGQFTDEHGPTFTLPRNGLARLACGQTTFVITATTRPRALPVPLWTWRWDEHVYSVGAALAMGIFLIMILAVPPDPKSLALDLFNADPRFIPFTIKPPEAAENLPDFVSKKPSPTAGGRGQRAKGAEGTMGKETAKNKDGQVAIKGPEDNPDVRLAKEQAKDNARRAGVLGILAQTQGSHIASIFGDTSALGSDAADVLGNLRGNTFAEAYGRGGLGVLGTGASGGGDREGLIGLSAHGTIGAWGGGGGKGRDYGTGVGRLATRQARPPEVLPGIGDVRGSLSKEIIRRIIRRHINEVKFCYEQELVRKPNLGGRLLVQFTIAPTAQVISSFLQNSTMGNPRVESCTVQAVRRWQFPTPEGGGMVMVSYPFVLAPAGGGES